MKIRENIQVFTELGNTLSDYLTDSVPEKTKNKIDAAIERAEIENPWFTKDNIRLAMQNIANQLEQDNLNTWLEKYPDINKDNKIKNIGVVSAGNIPMVGFNDFLCVLISGNKITLKLSSKDEVLLELIIELLQEINPELKEFIHIADGTLKDFDAIIATGSDNTSRYFEYYFEKYPNIIRKNRNSIAILNGNESSEELKLLADDIYTYFGLGCRNISKIYLPEGYDIIKMLDEFNHYIPIKNHNKFANNYTYNKSIYLMNKVAHYDNGFSLFKEDSGYASPIAVIFFEYYKNSHNLYNQINDNQSMIQCIVSNIDIFSNVTGFGNTQKPKLWDYADNIDTLKFLSSLN